MFLIVPYIATVVLSVLAAYGFSAWLGVNFFEIMSFVFVIAEIITVSAAAAVNGKKSDKRRRDKLCAILISVINAALLAASIYLFSNLK